MTVPGRAAIVLAGLAVALVALPSPAPAAARARGATPPNALGPTGPLGVAPTAPDPNANGGGIASTSDPLSANGLSSALCRASPPDLSAHTRSNCATSGISVAPVPVDHYSFDIHIDTPFLGLGGNSLAIVIQDVLLTPVWTALVWLIHALIVALEWCYAIDLLGSPTIGGVSQSLGQAERVFTGPWMVAVLSIAAVGLTYRGLVRRRVADSLADVTLMAAMIVAGLALIATPRETVGRLSALVNDASLGTLAAVASGDPRQPDQSLADGLQAVFDSSVVGPWCYLEFGNVNWCRNPGRLDHRLAAAAQKLAATDRQSLHCGPGPCGPAPGSKLAAQAREAPLVAAARTNGDLFLAFPANGPARNSINDSGSLLHALCGTYDATACSGPTASEAEFRTASGTWPRAGGLLFIAIGVIGMLALLAFICLRLIGAALLSVFFLLLAPVAVLAPALGDSGRSAFRSWLARLLGALMAKLVYSVFLGAVLLVVRLLQNMGALGWWTQWLLVAAFWWIVFTRREHVLELAMLGHRDMAGRGARLVRMPRASGLVVRRRPGLLRRPRPRVPGPPPPAPDKWRLPPTRPAPPGPATPDGPGPTGPRSPGRFPWLGGPGSGGALDQGASRTASDDDRAEHRDLVGSEGTAVVHAQLLQRLLDGTETQPDATAAETTHGDAERARLARLRDQEARARERGESRRAALLAARLHRLGARPLGPSGAVERVGLGDPAAFTGVPGGAPSRTETEGFLDRQATLRRGVPPGPRADAARYRNYSHLSWLVGLGPERYRRLDSSAARRARLAVDRHLREWVVHRRAHPPADTDVGDSSTRPATFPRSSTVPPTPVPRAGPAGVRARRARQFADAVRGERG